MELWSGRLPFPKMSDSRIKQLADSLDYPPRGSYEFGSLEEQINEEADNMISSLQPLQSDFIWQAMTGQGRE